MKFFSHNLEKSQNTCKLWLQSLSCIGFAARPNQFLKTKKRLQRNQQMYNAFRSFDSRVPFFFIRILLPEIFKLRRHFPSVWSLVIFKASPKRAEWQFSDTKWCPVTTKVSLAAVSYNNPSSIRTICRREQRHVLGWQNCGKTLMFHWKFAFLCCIFVVVFFSFKIGGDVLGTTSGLTN